MEREAALSAAVLEQGVALWAVAMQQKAAPA
jgi:hypothetical protein